MAYINLEGGNSSTSAAYWTGSPTQLDSANSLQLPAGRLAANGKRPISLIGNLEIFISGRGSAQSVEYRIGGSYQGTATIPAGSNASVRRTLPMPGVHYADIAAPTWTSIRLNYSSQLWWANVPGSGTIVHSGNNYNTAFAGRVFAAVVPTAPGSPTGTQTAVDSIALNWDAPADNGDSAITAYRIQYSQSPDFAGAQTLQTASAARTATITGLTAGWWYFRVAAINAVAAANSTSSVYSATGAALIIAESLPLDQWESFGTPPAAAVPIVPAGIRRAALDLPNSPIGIIREWNTLGSITIPAFSVGAVRPVTGLTPGKVYRIEAEGFINWATPPAGAAVQYALGAVGRGSGTGITLTDTPQQFPIYEFIAGSSTELVGVFNAAMITAAGSGEIERLNLYGFKLYELVGGTPYRLGNNKKDASLVQHLNTANNSVGGVYFCDRNGVLQFRATMPTGSTAATFTDEGEGLKYLDISATFNTEDAINDLTLRNLEGEETTAYNVTDLTSAATWGANSADIETNLYNEGAFAGSLADRAQQLLDQYSDPAVTYSLLRWNAQENRNTAAALEVYDPITVKYNRNEQPSRIFGIEHDITAKRWITTLEIGAQ